MIHILEAIRDSGKANVWWSSYLDSVMFNVQNKDTGMYVLKGHYIGVTGFVEYSKHGLSIGYCDPQDLPEVVDMFIRLDEIGRRVR